MTIKQQGGIFGRNPTFNEVTATNAEVTNQLDVKTISMVNNNPAIYLDDTDVADNNTRLRNQSGIFRIQDVADDGSTTTQVQLAHSTGDLTVSTGNLVIGTSGKGIDFSATSGTGTSELFDDYEEGIFTPTLTTSGTDFSSVTYDGFTGGKYVKVGNLVTVYGTVRTDAVTIGSASGAVCIGGLPFTSAAQTGATRDGSCPASISDATTWGADVPCAGQGNPSSTVLLLYKRASITGDMAIVVPADVATGANSNRIAFSMTYVAA